MSVSFVIVEFYGVLYLCDIVDRDVNVVRERKKALFSLSFNSYICRISKLLGLV